MRTREIAVIASCAVVFAGARASMQQGTATAAPTFHAGVNYVEFPVRVSDAKGNPIRDLSQADFDVFEDGTKQAISTFRVIDLPVPDGKKVADTANAPFVFSESSDVKGRVYVLVIDDYHLLRENTFQLKSLVQDFIRKKLGPDDVAAVMYTSIRHGQDFTTNRQALLKSLDGLIGNFDGSELVGAQDIRSVSSLEKLKSMIDTLGRVKNRQKSILYFSPTLGCSLVLAPGMTSVSNAPQARPLTVNTAMVGTTLTPTTSGRTGLRCFDTVRNVIDAAVRANVTIYSLDSSGVTAPGWVSPTIDNANGPGGAAQAQRDQSGTNSTGLFDGLRVLADETGGFAAVNMNAFAKSFDRIVRDNSAYYLIGYYSSNAQTDGTVRKNTVEVKRTGLTPNYRRQYTAAKN